MSLNRSFGLRLRLEPASSVGEPALPAIDVEDAVSVGRTSVSDLIASSDTDMATYKKQRQKFH